MNLPLPSSSEVRKWAGEVESRLAGRGPFLERFSLTPVHDTHELCWEQPDVRVQFTVPDDDFPHMQASCLLRNWEGARVNPDGTIEGKARSSITINRVCRATPGVYGEHIAITGKALRDREELALSVREAVGTLVARRFVRIEYNVIRSILTGELLGGPFGESHVVSSGGWTGHPLRDLRYSVQVARNRGGPCDLGPKAVAVMNANTFDGMARAMGVPAGDHQKALDQVNAYVAEMGLPSLCVYDNGRPTPAVVLRTFVPDGRIIVLGVPPGDAPLGQYRFTRNANNPDFASGPYTRVIHQPADSEYGTPETVDVHDGHNGGPVFFYATGIVVFHVGG